MSLLLMESAETRAWPGGQWDSYNPESSFATQDGYECFLLGNDRAPALGKNLGADEDDTIIVGMRWRTNGSETPGNDYIFQLRGDDGVTPHVTFVHQTDDTVNAYRGGTSGTLLGSTSFSFSPSVWYYLEIKVTVHDTTGTVDMRVDGNSVLSLTNQDTNNGGADNLIDRVEIGSGESTNNYGRDIVIMNSAGSAFNDFIGPCLITSHRADGAGNYTQWTPNTGTNWQAVDEHDPDSDTTYVESTSSGQRDSYTIQDAVTSGIDAVGARVVARYNVAPLDVGTFMRRSSTDSDGNLATPNAGTYADLAATIWETDPIAAGAWTVANFNSTEFGIRSSS